MLSHMINMLELEQDSEEFIHKKPTYIKGQLGLSKTGLEEIKEIDEESQMDSLVKEAAKNSYSSDVSP